MLCGRSVCKSPRRLKNLFEAHSINHEARRLSVSWVGTARIALLRF
jgi:hypothetical protein